MDTYTPHIEELDADDALRLMSQAPLGRVVFTMNALPMIRPVAFVLCQDGDVVIRVAADARTINALQDAVVAFQADEMDLVERSAWTVTVTGRTSVMDNPCEIERAEQHLPQAWARFDETAYFRIRPEVVTGRQFRRTAAA